MNFSGREAVWSSALVCSGEEAVWPSALFSDESISTNKLAKCRDREIPLAELGK